MKVVGYMVLGLVSVLGWLWLTWEFATWVMRTFGVFPGLIAAVFGLMIGLAIKESVGKG